MCNFFIDKILKMCYYEIRKKEMKAEPARVKNMYELIINGRTVYTTANKNDAQMNEMFNFYRTNKVLMNIKEIIIVNATENFFFEG